MSKHIFTSQASREMAWDIYGYPKTHESMDTQRIYSLPSHTKCEEVGEENRQALETIAKYTFSFCSPHYIHWLKTKLGQAWMRRQYEQDIL